MPFGAELVGDDRVRFRLWAPGARGARLRLEGPGGARELELTEESAGHLVAEVSGVGAGTRYAYRVEADLCVPDPASRFQPAGVHGASEVIDPAAYPWSDGGWRGRPWEEAVLYELHVGTFSGRGDYAGVVERLPHLLQLGVTALELMPLAECPGRWNWGYDGVLPFAPAARYGRPEQLKALVDAAHAQGLMVLLDVVYNHFGPEGNYLHRYAPGFFTDRHQTPWGDAIDFEGESRSEVRAFFVHNALYWLEEFHLDGLRLDAVHAIHDDSRPDILTELAATVRQHFGDERHLHLVLENDDNVARYLERDVERRPRAYTAQWNDDIHHAFHVILSGERTGYYADYADDPVGRLGRCLTEGFAYQGEPSPYRDGRRRGEPSDGLPLTAFVGFLQNHDQVGNRAFGERLVRLAPPDALRAAAAILLLAPSPPLLFMGEEWGCDRAFPFFCDFEPGLAASVREGRRREFASFPEFRDEAARERIPAPESPATFRAAVLDWSELEREPHRSWLAGYRQLLALRHREVVPRLAGLAPRAGQCERLGGRGLLVRWRLGDGTHLALAANLDDRPLHDERLRLPGRLLWTGGEAVQTGLERGALPAWAVAWSLDRG